MKPKKVIVTKESHYRPHQEFLHAAQVHLHHHDQKILGYDYSLLSSFLLSAFAFEAYMNSVGPIVERGWKDFDRASIFVKIRHILALVKIEADFSRDPLQLINELFKFRNAIAHPRDECVREVVECSADDYLVGFYSEPIPKVMAFATAENAVRCLAQIREMISLINDSLEEPDPCPFYSTGWTGGASLIE